MSLHDDLDPRPTAWNGFAPRPKGSVTAYAVRDGDELRGYLWYGDDPEENAAGMIGVLYPGTDGGNAPGPRLALLQSAWDAGVPAKEAVLDLVGSSDTNPRYGRVTEERSTWPDLEALRTAANPPEAMAAIQRERDRQAAASTDTGRDAIDEVLRGLRRPTPAIQEQIAALDSALAGKPLTDTVVVWFRREVLPTGPSGAAAVQGDRIQEPTYLRTRFDTPDADFGDAPVVVKVRVPAGTPAVFLEHAGGDPGAGSVLLLARGLTWTVSRVIDAGDRVFVFGVVDGA
jgi:hypothetical protein